MVKNMFRDRTEFKEEIFKEIEKLLENDMRVGQIFSNIERELQSEHKSLYFAENDVILKKLKKLNGSEN